VILLTAEAQAIRFRVNEVRSTGLPAGGMRGIKLNGDRVVSANIVREGVALWTVSEAGLAKSSPLTEYPLQGRAGSGVVTMKLTLGDRLAAATIANMNDLVIVLMQDGKFRVVKFQDSPHGQRALKGDFIKNLRKNDRVRALMQIVRRPEQVVSQPETGSAESSNGQEPG
jgi:DNA gyrase subunit A